MPEVCGYIRYAATGYCLPRVPHVFGGYLRYVVLCACIASDIWQVCGTCLRYVAVTSDMWNDVTPGFWYFAM